MYLVHVTATATATKYCWSCHLVGMKGGEEFLICKLEPVGWYFMSVMVSLLWFFLFIIYGYNKNYCELCSWVYVSKLKDR